MAKLWVMEKLARSVWEILEAHEMLSADGELEMMAETRLLEMCYWGKRFLQVALFAEMVDFQCLMCLSL